MQCREVVVGYEPNKPLIKKFDLDIRMKSRIGLLGVNGSGKTTLLRTLAKELEPLKGEVYAEVLDNRFESRAGRGCGRAHEHSNSYCVRAARGRGLNCLSNPSLGLGQATVGRSAARPRSRLGHGHSHGRGSALATTTATARPRPRSATARRGSATATATATARPRPRLGHGSATATARPRPRPARTQ